MNLYFAFRQTEGIESPVFDHLRLKSPLELEEKLCLFVCFGAVFFPYCIKILETINLRGEKVYFGFLAHCLALGI